MEISRLVNDVLMWLELQSHIQIQSTLTKYTYKVHLQSTLTKNTYKVHLQSTLTKYTYKVHLQSTLTKYTYKVNLQSTLTKYTYKVHLQSTLTKYTYKVHLQSTLTKRIRHYGWISNIFRINNSFQRGDYINIFTNSFASIISIVVSRETYSYSFHVMLFNYKTLILM